MCNLEHLKIRILSVVLCSQYGDKSSVNHNFNLDVNSINTRRSSCAVQSLFSIQYNIIAHALDLAQANPSLLDAPYPSSLREPHTLNAPLPASLLCYVKFLKF